MWTCNVKLIRREILSEWNHKQRWCKEGEGLEDPEGPWPVGAPKNITVKWFTPHSQKVLVLLQQCEIQTMHIAKLLWNG